MFERTHLREGMQVRSHDGRKLGHVIKLQDDGFEVEKGFFFVKDYECSFEEIDDIRDGVVILKHGEEALHRITIDEHFGPHAGLGGEPGVGALPGTGDGLPPYEHHPKARPPTLNASPMDAAEQARQPEEDEVRLGTKVDAERGYRAPHDDPAGRS